MASTSRLKAEEGSEMLGSLHLPVYTLSEEVVGKGSPSLASDPPLPPIQRETP